MLLSECERDWSKEETLIEDATMYQRMGNTWGTLHSYGNINLSSNGIVVISFKAETNLGWGDIRIKIGSEYVIATPDLDSDLQNYYAICYIASGSKAVVAECKNGASDRYCQISNFVLGHVELEDVDGEVIYSGTETKTLNVTSRSSFFGSVAKTVLGINVYGSHASQATNFENVGESLTNGVQVKVDGVQVDWHYRCQDNSAPYGAAHGIAHVSVSTGANHTVQITRDNANTIIHCSIISCPWLLGGDISEAHCPISLDFPQGSTLYVILEPMSGLQTIGIGYGRKHAASQGSSDYYSHEAGSGVQVTSYTFEAQKVSTMGFTVYGVTGCISYVALDMR